MKQNIVCLDLVIAKLIVEKNARDLCKVFRVISYEYTTIRV